MTSSASPSVPDGPERRLVGILRYSGFRRVLATSTLNQLGFWLTTIGFQWVLGRETGNDPFTLGLLTFCMGIPFLVLSLPAGAVADAHERRRLVLVTQLVAAGLGVVATLLVRQPGTATAVLLVVAFLCGCAVSVTNPGTQALVAETVPRIELASAVTLQSAGLNVARILGPALAGPVILLWGPQGAFILYSIGGLAAAGLMLRVPRVVPAVLVTTDGGLVHRITSGLAHVRARPPAGLGLATVAITSMFGISYMSQLPALAAQVSDDPGRAFLVMIFVAGIGSIGGVAFVGYRRHRVSVSAAAVELILLGGTIGILGAATSYIGVLLVLIAVGGLSFGVMTMLANVLQALVDDDQRGRIMSLYFICWGGLLPFGALALGLLSQAVGHTAAFAISGALASASGVVVLLLSRRYPVTDTRQEA